MKTIIFLLLSLTAVGQDTISYVQTLDIYSGRTDTVLAIPQHLEAPNWHADGYLVLNSKGKIYRLDPGSKKLTLINTGFANQCNNDHGISPDGKWLMLSHNDKGDTSTKPYKSAIYKVAVGGGVPVRVTAQVPSFWHGWSVDGRTIAFCGERNGNFDVYTIGVDGGEERRLTDDEGLDDGPDYSSDGKYIYFNSYRTGHMQIWRMGVDGSAPEQLTFDSYANWFAHPSPDNRWLVYIAYMSDEQQQHLFGKDVKLRLMDIRSKEVKDLTPVFYGGQGTINVPSWRADSRKVAFVSYVVQ